MRCLSAPIARRRAVSCLLLPERDNSKIGDIRASHQQHQSNRGEQGKQRGPHQSYVVGLQRRYREMQRLVGVFFRLAAKLGGNRFRFALRLPHRDALAQPADHS